MQFNLESTIIFKGIFIEKITEERCFCFDKKIAEATNTSERAVQQASRNEKFMESFLNRAGTDYKSLANSLGLPEKKSELVREIVKTINS